MHFVTVGVATAVVARAGFLDHEHDESDCSDVSCLETQNKESLKRVQVSGVINRVTAM